MPRIGICYDWKLLASVLANEDDSTQATFFKAFVKEIQSWPCSTFQRGQQMCFINEKLTEEEKDLLGFLGHIKE